MLYERVKYYRYSSRISNPELYLFHFGNKTPRIYQSYSKKESHLQNL